MIRAAVAFAAVLMSATAAQAQELLPASDELSHYERVLELGGDVQRAPLVFYSASRRTQFNGVEADSTHPWRSRYPFPAIQRTQQLTVRPLGWQSHWAYNSGFPRTANDGALWAGRGISFDLSAGAEFRYGVITARLYPTAVFGQNEYYPLAPVADTSRSAYSYPWHAGIDYPQRFGGGNLRRIDPGQTAVRVDIGAFTAGISTEELWWGPGYRNALIMSNTAPGFPHLDLGTGAPARTPIGKVEARILWGLLYRSPYADGRPEDDPRLLNGIVIGYQPSFLPDLTLGLTRVYYQNWPAGGPRIGDFLNVFAGFFNGGNHPLPNGGVGNDLGDQLASVTVRWLIPAGRFEAYFEWARTDFAGNLRDFLIQPDHSRAYTLGFQKRVSSKAGPWALAMEVTNLGSSPNSLIRVPVPPTWYAHNFALAGYTNHGQLMGAAIGPGSQSQYLGLDRYTAGGRWGVFIERIRYDDDWYLYGAAGQSPYRNVPFGYLSEQVDLTAGFSLVRFLGPIDIGGSLELTQELNRYFQANHDVTNLKLSASLSWHTTRNQVGRLTH